MTLPCSTSASSTGAAFPSPAATRDATDVDDATPASSSGCSILGGVCEWLLAAASAAGPARA